MVELISKKKNNFCLMLLLTIFLGINNRVYSQDSLTKAVKSEASRELTFKALFINNFIKYVTWPDDAIEDKFVLGVLNDENLEKVLIKSTSQIGYGEQKIPIQVVHLDNIENISNVHVLYSDKKQNGYTSEDLFKAIENRPTLLITENYEDNSTMINLKTINTQQKFEVNKENLTASGLSIDPKLLPKK